MSTDLDPTNLTQHNDRLLLATLLRKQMDRKNYTIRETAQICGIGRGTVADILNGQCSPKMDTLYKVMRGMEMPRLLSDLEMLA